MLLFIVVFLRLQKLNFVFLNFQINTCIFSEPSVVAFSFNMNITWLKVGLKCKKVVLDIYYWVAKIAINYPYFDYIFQSFSRN